MASVDCILGGLRCSAIVDAVDRRARCTLCHGGGDGSPAFFCNDNNRDLWCAHFCKRFARRNDFFRVAVRWDLYYERVEAREVSGWWFGCTAHGKPLPNDLLYLHVNMIGRAHV